MLRLRAVRPLGFIEACQPTTGLKPPIGPGWIHKIKHDGYRMLALRRRARPPAYPQWASASRRSSRRSSCSRSGPCDRRRAGGLQRRRPGGVRAVAPRPPGQAAGAPDRIRPPGDRRPRAFRQADRIAQVRARPPRPRRPPPSTSTSAATSCSRTPANSAARAIPPGRRQRGVDRG